jgi:signal transduction histidine kinase
MIARSLTFRLAAWYCGVLLVLGAAFAIYTAAGFTRYMHATSQRTLEGRAEEIWAFARPLLDDRAALAAAIRNRFEPEGQNRFIRISVDGTVVYRSGPPVEATFDPGQVPVPRTATAEGLKHEGGLYIIAKAFLLPDGRVAIVESGHPDRVLRDARRGMETLLIVALPMFLAVATLGGWVLARRALAPVSQMIAAAEALSFNSPDKRLPLAGALEPIASLGQSLNRMLDRLESAYQHVGQFSAEAAHELRTPLAIVRGELELIQRSAELPQQFRAAFAAVLQEAVRLAHIVESLSTLARMGSFWGKQAHLPVDLQELASETVEQMRLLAEDKAVTLRCTAGGAAMVMGDRNRLKQVLVNLVDNAVKFTPPGGRVTVSSASSATSAVVTVADSGIGIAAEHHPRIFERSYRVDNATCPGAGLGLAIVKSICLAHGGVISLTSAPGAGSSFRVELPRGLEGRSSRRRSGRVHAEERRIMRES